MLLQAPIFMSLFFTLRGMAEEATEPTFLDGGISWLPGIGPVPFYDLTMCDPTYPPVLPILCGMTFLATIEAGGDAEAAAADQSSVATRAMMKNFMRGLACCMPLFVWNFPLAVFCFWIPNNMFSCSQALAFRSHRFKSLLGIPDARVQFTAAEVFGRDEAKLLEAIDPAAAMKAGATTRRVVQQKKKGKAGKRPSPSA